MKITYNTVKKHAPVLITGECEGIKFVFLGRWNNWYFAAGKDVKVIDDIGNEINGDEYIDRGYWDFSDKRGYGASYMPKKTQKKIIKNCFRRMKSEREQS